MKRTLLLSIVTILFNNFIAQTHTKSVVTYLGHCGWSVKINNNFLIFDYQERERYEFDWGEQKPAKNLAAGYIIPDEIKDYNVYVFVSHSHIDHFHKVIFDWENEVENIKYFFGWDYKSDKEYHCLKAPRGEYKDEDIEIYTINSHHSGVPESAFLVTIDGLTIYFNGDYKSDYKNDFKYLKTKTEKIDFAFSISDAYDYSQYLHQALLLVNEFDVKHFFPMHHINNEAEYKVFGNMLTEYGAKTTLNCAEIKGDEFILEVN